MSFPIASQGSINSPPRRAKSALPGLEAVLENSGAASSPGRKHASFSATQRQEIKWRCLSKTLYIEIILDGSPYADLESLQKFIQVFDWTIDGSISEREFTELYRVWLDSSNGVKEKKTISQQVFLQCLDGYPVKRLDIMLGMLINEHNRLYTTGARCSTEWLQMVEHLFFLLDCKGHGFITLDEVLLLMLALTGEDAVDFTPDSLLAKTRDFILEVGPFAGVLTLRRFKEFFLNNGLDWRKLSIVGSEHGIPRIWEQAVLDAEQAAGVMLSTQQISSIRSYLLSDSHQVRLQNVNVLFTEAGSSAIVSDYGARYDPDSLSDKLTITILRSFVQQALGYYRRLVQGVLSSFSPANHQEITSVRSQASVVLEPAVSANVQPVPAAAAAASTAHNRQLSSSTQNQREDRGESRKQDHHHGQSAASTPRLEHLQRGQDHNSSPRQKHVQQSDGASLHRQDSSSGLFLAKSAHHTPRSTTTPRSVSNQQHQVVMSEDRSQQHLQKSEATIDIEVQVPLPNQANEANSSEPVQRLSVDEQIVVDATQAAQQQRQQLPQQQQVQQQQAPNLAKLSLIDALRINLDVNKVIRSAEWKDMRRSNLNKAAFLPVGNKFPFALTLPFPHQAPSVQRSPVAPMQGPGMQLPQQQAALPLAARVAPPAPLHLPQNSGINDASVNAGIDAAQQQQQIPSSSAAAGVQEQRPGSDAAQPSVAPAATQAALRLLANGVPSEALPQSPASQTAAAISRRKQLAGQLQQAGQSGVVDKNVIQLLPFLTKSLMDTLVAYSRVKARNESAASDANGEANDANKQPGDASQAPQSQNEDQQGSQQQSPPQAPDTKRFYELLYRQVIDEVAKGNPAAAHRATKSLDPLSHRAPEGATHDRETKSMGAAPSGVTEDLDDMPQSLRRVLQQVRQQSSLSEPAADAQGASKAQENVYGGDILQRMRQQFGNGSVSSIDSPKSTRSGQQSRVSSFGVREPHTSFASEHIFENDDLASSPSNKVIQSTRIQDVPHRKTPSDPASLKPKPRTREEKIAAREKGWKRQ